MLESVRLDASVCDDLVAHWALDDGGDFGRSNILTTACAAGQMRYVVIDESGDVRERFLQRRRGTELGAQCSRGVLRPRA